MKRIQVILCALLISLSVAPVWHVPQAYAQTQTVSATVTFRVVSAVDYRGLNGARVIVVDSGGRVIQSGLTDANGVWSVPLTVKADPRFEDLGVVTAICVANGHNENVAFEVPVRQGTVQPITLYPVKPKLRNEASASLGQLHHLDVIAIVNKYAAQVGLTRQPGLTGESGYAPWSPNLK
ncbi:hypothetical protein [Alicyclobacillus acidoterrestris]|uniref:Uncharacterized protein n=1 Tax=Alicyclobacillus acidoterrestris (strain ATCC 49025 / DSM 3922 / CIP 106132 / NCIMB 13137 / GD3B) TaxID=1356854 RepID=T0CS76_ALIAG|nr:hypothetical protein [Alicyclobacillus acidoterrestris]EPZ42302.1 hypothetical protein N007_15490 [Alicyclobacillus acidoterrestris ATCC 49025]UNO48132.1 hypothetical protein K1I37_15810 [Alicyclobacillus acidoterrestris]